MLQKLQNSMLSVNIVETGLYRDATGARLGCGCANGDMLQKSTPKYLCQLVGSSLCHKHFERKMRERNLLHISVVALRAATDRRRTTDSRFIELYESVCQRKVCTRHWRDLTRQRDRCETSAAAAATPSPQFHRASVKHGAFRCSGKRQT